MFRWIISEHAAAGVKVNALAFGIEPEFADAIRAGRDYLANTYWPKDATPLRLYVQHGNGVAIDVTPDELAAHKSIYAGEVEQ